MAGRKSTRPAPRHQRLYAALMVLYPRAYRSRFGADMALAFSERHADAATRGKLSLMWLWLGSLASLFWNVSNSTARLLGRLM